MADEVDLDALLESALDDFKKEPEPIPTPTTRPPPTTQPIIPEIPKTNTQNPTGMPNLDEMDPMKALTAMLSDPKMKEEFERDFGAMFSEFNATAGSDGEAPFSLDNLRKELDNLTQNFANEVQSGEKKESTTSTSTPQGLADTLENLMNNAKDLNEGAGVEGFDDSILSMLKDIESNPELSNMMETMMEKFMSKEVLYEGLKELREAFVKWMKENEKNLPKDELAQRRIQLEAIDKALEIYDNDSELDQADADRIMSQMESIGSLPDGVLEAVGKGPSGEQPPCSIM